MNMKDSLILLVFLLAVLGLLAGVHYTNESDIEKTHESSLEKVSEDDNGVITITLEPKEKENVFISYFEKKIGND